MCRSAMEISTISVTLAVMALFFPGSIGGHPEKVARGILPDNTNETHPCDGLKGDPKVWRSTAQRVKLIIVGGGVSGLMAAKTLIENKFTDFLLLEAEDYLGGRVRTYRHGNILVEDGAEWIHGGPLNPLYRVGSELQEVAPYLRQRDYDWRILTKDGIPSEPSKYQVLDLMDKCVLEAATVNYIGSSYGQCYLDRFEDAYGPGANSSLGRAWLHLLEQVVSYEEGTGDWLESSAWDTAQYSNYGQNFQWKNGYDTIVNYLKGIELGVVDKIQMGWPQPWWGDKPMWYSILWTELTLPTEMWWMYGIVEVKSVHQHPNIIQAFVTGRHAIAMESLPEETVKAHVLSLLANVTGNEVHNPIFFRRSQWGSNPWAQGAYSSFVTVKADQAGLHPREAFRVPLQNSKGKPVLFWAGEHASITHYSTVDGAIISGRTIAADILKYM